MGNFKSYRDESKTNYGHSSGGNANREQINAGSLQRIADATETMAEGFAAVLGKLEHAEKMEEYFREQYVRKRDQVNKLECQVNGYKGQVAKMRKQIQKLQNQ